MSNWVRTSRHRRCPICERPDWCSISADATVACCMRIGEGSFRTLNTQLGPAYLHKLTDDNEPPRQTTMASLHKSQRQAAPPKIDALDVARTCRDAISEDEIDMLADSLGLSMDSLNRLRVGYSEPHNAYTFPMRDEHEQVIGIRLRAMDGRKWAIRGSRAGLFIPNPLSGEGPLLVCEGPTDTAALLATGYDAIGRPSNCGGADQVVAYCRRIKRRKIVIIHDRDQRGSSADANTRRGAVDLGDRLARIGCMVRIIAPPKHKDVRSWNPSRAWLDSIIRNTRLHTQAPDAVSLRGVGDQSRADHGQQRGECQGAGVRQRPQNERCRSASIAEARR